MIIDQPCRDRAFPTTPLCILAESIIHSMVETADSSVLAQLGWPDMRLPILYTMSWPERVNCSEQTWPRLDFVKMGDLTFRKPDRQKYPAMDLAYAAGRAGGTMTGVLSAANEQAVEQFINEEIHYLEISECCGARDAMKHSWDASKRIREQLFGARKSDCDGSLVFSVGWPKC